MSEGRRKSEEVKGIPIAIGRSKAKGTLKPECEPSPPAGQDGATDTSHSEINKSEIEHPKRRSPLEHRKKINTSEKSEIKMEVHHHPDLHHKKKHWKEYFLEFLMIFLAVTMGFFAETIRENIAENSKGRELAKSLYGEVYADSVYMQAKIKFRLDKERHMEYFRKYVSDSSLTHLSENFYPAFAWTFIVTSTNLFEPNDGIMNQLRNSGSLRYIKSIEVQNYLSRLNVIISKIRERNSQELAFVDSYTRPVMLKHYDFKWEDEYTQNGKLSVVDALAQPHFHPSVPPFIKHLNEFSREDAEGLAAYYLLIIIASRQVFYVPYVNANHELLQALRKEYNFKK